MLSMNKQDIVHNSNKTTAAIQSNFELPTKYVGINTEEMEYITGGVIGDHWDFVSCYYTEADIAVMLGIAGVTFGMGVAITVGAAACGAFTFGVSIGIGIIVGAISSNLANSMYNAAKVAYNDYYLKGKGWSLYAHWGWFGTVLDGFETRA